jgi:hypothetical protein
MMRIQRIYYCMMQIRKFSKNQWSRWHKQTNDRGSRVIIFYVITLSNLLTVNKLDDITTNFFDMLVDDDWLASFE